MTTAKLSDMMSRLGRRLPKDAPADSKPDGDLLARFLATRDEHAFELIVRRHGPMVLGVCRRVTGNHHLAEDAFQAVFVVLAAKAASVRPRTALPAWLYGVAHRTSLRARTMSDRRRRRESQVAALAEPAEVLPDPVEAADTIAVLDEEIARLPDHLRAAVVLCELQGCSRHEAAKHLAVAEGTLSSRLATARKALARRLHQRGLALSAASLTAALGRVASASVPPALTEKAVAAALAPQLIPATVAALSNGVLRMMLAQKLKAIPVAVAFLVGVVFAGGLLGSDVSAVPAPAKTALALVDVAKTAAPEPAPRAMPKGVERLIYWSKGSLRLIDPNGKNERRLGDENERSVPANVRISPDGKQFAGIMAVVPPGEPIPADLRLSLYVRGFDEKWPGTDLGVECQMFCWSPDGSEIAFSNFEDAPNKESPEATHGIVNVKTKKVTVLPIPPEHIITDWSRDGKRFLTTRVIGGKDGPKGQLFLINRDGGINKTLTDATKMSFLGKFSPNGKRVLFQRGRQGVREPQKRPGLGILEIATGKIEDVADMPINGEVQGFCWSPDGKRIAYTWTELHDKDSDSRETTTSLVVSEPNGKNQKTVATDTVPTGHLSIMFVDWGFVIDDDKKKEKTDAEKIIGVWRPVSIIDGGNDRDTQGARVVFTESKVTLTDDKKDVPGEFKLDPSKKPKWIDITVDGRTMPGIYELDGDNLRICLNEIAEGERPTGFESKGGSSPNDLLMVLEREKK